MRRIKISKKNTEACQSALLVAIKAYDGKCRPKRSTDKLIVFVTKEIVKVCGPVDVKYVAYDRSLNAIFDAKQRLENVIEALVDARQREFGRIYA